ncbi:MAG: patatin-like phospholipase family protein [Deltaproteobacteria bacterium]|nr:patatin-like phospholipase family protein [Candidatus Zymogenaceae bacterium]
MPLRRIKGLTIMACLVFVLSGCSVLGTNFLVYTQDVPQLANYRLLEDGDYFLAVAVSGGGSRSAVWSAAVFRELFEQVKLPDGRSILDEIDYISCVSGGSVSSAYYCLNKPDVDTTHEEEYKLFFEQYLKDMRSNIEAAVFYRPPNWYRVFLEPEEKAYFLKWHFEKKFYGTATFDDLYKRQVQGLCPTLIINTTHMDSGAKFLFSTIPPKEFEMTQEDQEELFGHFLESGILSSNILFEEGILNTMFCRDIGVNIGEIEVSRAVVASSAVPLVFGPLLIEDKTRSTPEEPVYVHLNDGGIGDTLGLESIMQLAMKRFCQKDCPYKKGMVIIIDANQRIDPTDTEEVIRAFGLEGMVERTRVVYAYRGKTLAYYAIMFIQSNPRFNDISFVYISPYLVEDPELIERVDESPYPKSFMPPELGDIVNNFKATPTRFKIDPALADSIEFAAEIVVGGVRSMILDNYLEGCGISNDTP